MNLDLWWEIKKKIKKKLEGTINVANYSPFGSVKSCIFHNMKRENENTSGQLSKELMVANKTSTL